MLGTTKMTGAGWPELLGGAVAAVTRDTPTRVLPPPPPQPSTRLLAHSTCRGKIKGYNLFAKNKMTMNHDQSLPVSSVGGLAMPGLLFCCSTVTTAPVLSMISNPF